MPAEGGGGGGRDEQFELGRQGAPTPHRLPCQGSWEVNWWDQVMGPKRSNFSVNLKGHDGDLLGGHREVDSQTSPVGPVLQFPGASCFTNEK